MAARDWTCVLISGLAVMSTVSTRSLPSRSLAEASPNPATSTSLELIDGLGAYVRSVDNYSDFYAALSAGPNGILDINSSVPTQNITLLLPNNEAVRSGFAQLAEQYNITDPDTFFDRVVSVADINYRPPGYHGGTEILASKQEAAGLVIYNFVRSHVLRGVYDFYSNSTILQAPYQSPVNVTTSLGLAFSPEDSDLLAFGEATAPGPEIVYLRAPLGLLNIDTGVPVSRNHLTALNGTNTEYVYDIDGIFMFSGDALPADVGVDCRMVPNLPPNTNCGSGEGALIQLSTMDF